MKASVVGLVHTVPALAATFFALANDLFPPDVAVITIVDDSLLRLTRESGSVSPMTRRRLAGHVWSAEDAGADIVMVTCSSMGSAVEVVRPLCRVPLLRVDEPMVGKALEIGGRVGVLATLPTTLEPTATLLRNRAAANGQQVVVIEALAEGAFDAAGRGDFDTHDELIAAEFGRLLTVTDVVVLAQASMARVVAALPAQDAVPVLSSPQLAMQRVADLLAELG